MVDRAERLARSIRDMLFTLRQCKLYAAKRQQVIPSSSIHAMHRHPIFVPQALAKCQSQEEIVAFTKLFDSIVPGLEDKPTVVAKKRPSRSAGQASMT